jgi:hypothetical protein
LSALKGLFMDVVEQQVSYVNAPSSPSSAASA